VRGLFMGADKSRKYGRFQQYYMHMLTGSRCTLHSAGSFLSINITLGLPSGINQGGGGPKNWQNFPVKPSLLTMLRTCTVIALAFYTCHSPPRNTKQSKSPPLTKIYLSLTILITTFTF